MSCTLQRAAREVYHWSKLRHPNVQELSGVVVFRGGLGESLQSERYHIMAGRSIYSHIIMAAADEVEVTFWPYNFRQGMSCSGAA